MQSKSLSAATVLKYLQFILFTAVLLYFGRTLFIPLFFGLLIAIIMFPVCKLLENKGWPKALAITTCLLIVAIFLSLLLGVFIWQIKAFTKEAPAILSRLGEVFKDIQAAVNKTLNIGADDQNNWGKDLSGTFANFLKSTVQITVSTTFMLFIIPIYTALFLYHRKIFTGFLRSLTPLKYRHQLDTILHQAIHTYFSFIKGMVLVYLIVGILNSIGLFLLGVKHPILFGMLCAIMTIIPYLGTIVSSALPISMVWVQTGNIWYPLGVIAVFGIVQYLEANVIYPKAVGTQLHVSTLAMLVAMFAGSIIWGVAGMVLFIPAVAILKIISDNIEELGPLNLLLSRK